MKAIKITGTIVLGALIVFGLISLMNRDVKASQISGTVQAVNGASLSLDGKTILTDANTRVNGAITPGSVVSIQATVLEDGSLLARKVEVSLPRQEWSEQKRTENKVESSDGERDGRAKANGEREGEREGGRRHRSTPTPPPPPPPTQVPPPPSIGDGAQLYAAFCAGCHGVNQQGGAGPALTPARVARMSTSEMANTIARGDDGMPGFGNVLSATQITSLINWLKNPVTPPTVTPPPTPTPTPGAGPTPTPAAIDAAALYASYCSVCHGTNRLGGIGPALTASALSGRTVSQVAGVISSGTGSMPPYAVTLSLDQINALANWLKITP